MWGGGGIRFRFSGSATHVLAFDSPAVSSCDTEVPTHTHPENPRTLTKHKITQSTNPSPII